MTLEILPFFSSSKLQWKCRKKNIKTAMTTTTTKREKHTQFSGIFNEIFSKMRS